MRRRVELAKGLLNQPEILLLDEPSTGLDPSARIDLWKSLVEIQASGVTILLTTHLMDEGRPLHPAGHPPIRSIDRLRHTNCIEGSHRR